MKKEELLFNIVYSYKIATFESTTIVDYVCAIIYENKYVCTLPIYDSNYTDMVKKCTDALLNYLDKEVKDFHTISPNTVFLTCSLF